MSGLWPRLLGTLLLGVVAAGPLAALALVAAPAAWRGPALPAAVLVCTVLVALLARHGRSPNGRARDHQGTPS